MTIKEAGGFRRDLGIHGHGMYWNLRCSEHYNKAGKLTANSMKSKNTCLHDICPPGPVGSFFDHFS